MISFHGNNDLKRKLLTDIIEDRRMDRFVQRCYMQDGRGCHLGCCVKSTDKDFEGDWHVRFSELYGFPLSLAYLQECFFERLPIAQARVWSESLIDATPVGVDLTVVYHRFMHWLLMDARHGVINHADDRGKKSVELVGSLHEMAAVGKEVSVSEWDAARDAARDAAAAFAAFVPRTDACAAFAPRTAAAAAYVDGAYADGAVWRAVWAAGACAAFAAAGACAAFAAAGACAAFSAAARAAHTGVGARRLIFELSRAEVSGSLLPDADVDSLPLIRELESACSG